MKFLKGHRVKALVGTGALVAVLALMSQGGSDESVDLIVRPSLGPFQVAVTTSGELQARNSVKIYGPNNARQVGIFQMQLQRLVPEGTVVRQGDFVAELDRSEVGTKIQTAQIEVEKAQSQYEQTMLDSLMDLSRARDEQINLLFTMEEAKLRMEQATFEAPSVRRQAEIDFDRADRTYQQAVTNYATQVRQAEARMREVEANLSKARNELANLMAVSQEFTILAPENGMVIYQRSWNGQKLTSGGTVNAWDPVVAELPDLSQMESVTYVNEVDIQKIRTGQQVMIRLDADSDKRLTGTVTQIANIGEQRPNSDAKVFEVKVLVAESDTTLRPAMTTSNTIVVAELENSLSVPIESVHTLDSLNFVFVREGRRPVRKEVRLGLLNENAVIVQAGLAAEDEIYLSLPADTQKVSLHRLDSSMLGISAAN